MDVTLRFPVQGLDRDFNLNLDRVFGYLPASRIPNKEVKLGTGQEIASTFVFDLVPRINATEAKWWRAELPEPGPAKALKVRATVRPAVGPTSVRLESGAVQIEVMKPAAGKKP